MGELGSLLNLILPYFSIIGLGFLIGKWKAIPEFGLAWMNFFIIYVALPPLFFRLIADKPLEELANIPFVLGTMLSTYVTFAIAFTFGVWRTRGDGPDSSSLGRRRPRQCRLYGAAAGDRGAGRGASAPVALVFVSDVLLFFTMVPLLMALAGAEKRGFFAALVDMVWRILTHPFNIAAALGFAAAYYKLAMPGWIDRTTLWLSSASAPAALFVLGVTVALRPATGALREAPPLVFIKLVVHPLVVWGLLSIIGDFDPAWVYAAVLMAALPPALTSFVFANSSTRSASTAPRRRSCSEPDFRW